MKIEGKNAVIEAIKSGKTINSIYVSKENTDGQINQILSQARKNKIKISYVDKNKLNKISETKHHQGIIAESVDFSYSSLEDIFSLAEEKNESPFILLLDGIEDPHNLGAIIRTAECAGVHGIVLPNRRACPVNETVIKTSTGAIEYVKICMVTNLNQTIELLKQKGVWIYAVELGGQNLFTANLKGSIALVIGSEGNGVSKLTKTLCDDVLTIPMKGNINSLNASVACGISVFEALKQRV